MTGEQQGVLLTGATGFLGGEVLARLLERDQRPVYALVRAADAEQARERLDGVIASLLGSAEPWAGRTVAVAADLTEPGLGLDPVSRDWLSERVEAIIHCAASVSFSLDLESSRAINVDGTRRVLELAELCASRGSLDYLLHVSTAYVAGTYEGRFGERHLDLGQRFRNPYERSKFEAEMLLRVRGDGLPIQVVRPSIVVGDSRTGWTPSFNVVYGPLRAASTGAMKAIPARRSSPVDVVPVDYVADSLLALAGRPGTTHHLVAGDQASSVGELVELLGDYTGRRPPRVLSPRVYRRAVHPVLVRRGSEARRRALRRTEVLFDYFSMGVRYDDTLTREALADRDLQAPPLASYFERLMQFAEGANWGRALPPRHEAVSNARQRAASHGPVVGRPAYRDAF
jgi:long-chain acyl-CoA synthetase